MQNIRNSLGLFRSTALKLTGWYLTIIMLLTIGTSIALYNVSANDLRNSIGHQINFFSEILNPDDFRDYAHLRERQLSEDLDHLKAKLILFNVVVFVAGGVVSYVTARKTLEPIENALESQTRFTADASHELRTPLTAMQTEIEVALRNKSLTKSQAVDIIKSNLEEVARLKSLSEGLLLLAQTSGKISENSTANLSDVIDGATDRLAKTAKAKNIRIENKVKNIIVKGEQQNLTELFVILVDNAIKYSQAGSKVYIDSQKSGKVAKISVRDEGIGINKTDLPNIFKRFYRADSSRSKAKSNGYGLGLAIAKKIIDAHGGEITVRSAPGKGSTFVVSLPVA
jgi:two-component system sensor histidine kinase CiaH